MDETHVVTCFLVDAEGRLLLLKRGQRVGSHRGKWAGVSGFLEAEPREQAYTEISEEVGLGRDQVTLLVQGEPVRIEDVEMGRIWVVHPFLFSVTDPALVKLDWEHTEFNWIYPIEMKHYQTVPGLADAFRRVGGQLGG